jgi:alkylation response protein AidB-like acyl-CoA dehydrogenase
MMRSPQSARRDWLLVFLNERTLASLRKALASLPRLQEEVGKIEALLMTNRVLLDQAARTADSGARPNPAHLGLLKFTVTGNAIEAVELAL